MWKTPQTLIISFLSLKSLEISKFLHPKIMKHKISKMFNSQILKDIVSFLKLSKTNMSKFKSSIIFKKFNS